MSKTNPTESSVAGAHPSSTISHPTLTEAQVLAAHWLAELPLGMTWKQKAAKLGIDVVTLRAYRATPEFLDLVISVSRTNLRAEIPGAHRAMIRGMHAGGSSGARYLELFFKITGELTDQEQANALRGWLEAISDCSSDMLQVAIQRTTVIATRTVGTPGSRVVASGENVAQGASMELTATPPPVAVQAVQTGSLEL